ncbi:MAG TPA: FAD-dependent monooxygenase [Acetobacteraceae bacterium]|nr:FAD-dependent monooxygenase [Acetobacteraceae bacterium]
MRATLIIGGGPAGAAAAALIAATGHPVTLVERNASPTDKLCGDFLSGAAIAALHALGLDPLTLGAVPVRTIRLVHRRTAAETALPFAALGLSRRSLDEALLRLAARRGATILRDQAVRGLERVPSGFIARTATAGLLAAGTVFLATGKHDLRNLARPARPNGLLGLKMYYDIAPDQRAALHGCIELLLVRGGYAGLQLVEHGRAVLCMLLPAARYRAAGSRWDPMLDSLAAEAPLLARRLAGATPCLERPLAIAGIPYGHLHRAVRHAPPGLFRLGDQACVVPSFAGDGIAIALQSAMAATSVWLRGGSAAGYHASFARQARAPMRFASLIHFACRTPALQPVVAVACRAWPGTLRFAASLTRVVRPA